jgi:hypothetical protein
VKVAEFTVRATMAQSARWKQAAAAEGHSSVGAWLSGAADAYLRQQTLAGRPRPLAWRRATFRAILDAGSANVRGHVSPPFAFYRGDSSRQHDRACHHSLTYLPTGRILATLPTARDCRALASELARLWIRGDGSEPDQAEPVRALLSVPRL